MRLPTPLLRKNSNAHKNQFGHVLILAGSRDLLGAAALSALAAMRGGAGLVTVGLPQSLVPVLQKKISPVIMTLSLPETPQQCIGQLAFQKVTKLFHRYSVIALGPGLSQDSSTQKFILQVVKASPIPLVIDADGLNALANRLSALNRSSAIKILTPHPGEMARLTGLSKEKIEADRRGVAKDFAKNQRCILLLKGHQTVIAAPDGKIAINKTGNPGMATAGSGDVLTGMIAAFLGQGLTAFEAAKWGAYLHGLAGDLAVKTIPPASLIATDIIDYIPRAFARCANR